MLKQLVEVTTKLKNLILKLIIKWSLVLGVICILISIFLYLFTKSIINAASVAGYGISIIIIGRAIEERFYNALARVNFNNEFYTLIRVIDGDTIVVKPPESLSNWMKDIHIRLYGLETPELWETEGEKYRYHLHDLCKIDAMGKLYVIWERERKGTSYEGYPKISFEREIGHLFFDNGNGLLLYINGLMHILEMTSIYRDNKSLLRGHKLLKDLEERVLWSGSCATNLLQVIKSDNQISGTLNRVIKRNPPICLLSYPKMDILRASMNSESLAEIIANSITMHECPFSEIGNTIRMRKNDLNDQWMSPFDIPLLMVHKWKEKTRNKNEQKNNHKSS